MYYTDFWKDVVASYIQARMARRDEKIKSFGEPKRKEFIGVLRIKSGIEPVKKPVRAKLKELATFSFGERVTSS